MKQQILFLLALALPVLLSAQSARLKVSLDPVSEQMMQAAGFEMDHGIVKPGIFIISDYSATERAWMDEHGISYEVQIENVSQYYAERVSSASARGGRADCGSATSSTYPTPSGFQLGSMGGFFTYQEFLDHLDLMAVNYPQIITPLAQIDTFLSHEGRPIYWLKISDNASVDENEPEVLYTSIHHAREPQSLSQLIFYMYYLLENYGTDAEVTHLVDNTEMYFIPMINPDGYVYNGVTDPNGGGLWRKNRRDNLNGDMGVDLNRNYGYNWGLDNTGSSPNTNSETYRGPSAFSEPETRAVKWLCEQHDFRIALNYHAFGNYVIYPWGFQETPLSPDSLEFIAFAEQLTRENAYVFGTGFQTVGYAVNGDSDDWMYGEQTSKPKIFSMTPEVGNQDDGFWPAQDRIIPLAEENVLPNLLNAHMVGNYITFQDLSDGFISTTSGTIDLEIQRVGLEYSGTNAVELIPVSSNVLSTGAAVALPTLNHLGVTSENLSFTLDPGIQAGEVIEFDVELTMGDFSTTERITKTYGSPTIIYSENASSFGDFDDMSAWAITTEDFVSAPSSFTDSPNSEYFASASTDLAYNRIIDLRNAIVGELVFQAQWAIEAGWDYCQLQASPVDEDNWQPVCALYTKNGSGNQDVGQPLWDGFSNGWLEEHADLSDFIGQRIKVRFQLVTDQFVEFDGYYVDDFEFHILQDPNSSQPLDTGFVDTAGILDPTGIEDLQTLVKVFPNPTDKLLNIEFSQPMAASSQVTLMNLAGQQVLTETLRLSRQALDVSELPSGTYLLELRNGGAVYRQPVIIQ